MVNPHPQLRVLVVDDSAFNRRNLGDLLSANVEVEVVGKASDGEEALRLVTELKPDLITLDLEMPRMDGFTFLRILMSKMPTPVVVVSSYSQKENVFKALELGAIDFVAKPDRYVDSQLESIRSELVKKVLLARTLKSAPFFKSWPRAGTFHGTQSTTATRPQQRSGPPRKVVVIASSTGGPTALMEIFSRLPARHRDAFLVAQHMPEKFTRTFAERLDRRSKLTIAEGQDQDELGPGCAFVCPGGRCMEVFKDSAGVPRVRVVAPDEGDRYVPSADRLFESAARHFGSEAVGVVLTGMGDDGLLGAKALRAVAAPVVAESEASAVVYGMPGVVTRAGHATRSLSLMEIANWLASP